MITINIASKGKQDFILRWTPGEAWPQHSTRFGLLHDTLYLVTAQGQDSLDWISCYCLGLRWQPGDRRNPALTWTGDDALFIINSIFKFPVTDPDTKPY